MAKTLYIARFDSFDVIRESVREYKYAWLATSKLTGQVQAAGFCSRHDLAIKAAQSWSLSFKTEVVVAIPTTLNKARLSEFAQGGNFRWASNVINCPGI